MSILVLTSDTLIGTPATGNLEYNGQFYGTDSNASRAQMQRITQGTAVASTSGTSIDFTGIPSWVKRITLMVNGVSTNSTSNLQIQLGVSGTPETTGYSTISGVIATTNNTTRSATPTTGFPFSNASNATSLYYGTFIFTLIGSNVWSGFGNVYDSFGGIGCVAGAKTLAGTLNMIRLTTINGTDTFDAGTVNIIYEG